MCSSWMMDVGENITGELTNSFVEWTTSAAYILTTYILTKRTDFFIWHSERCLSNRWKKNWSTIIISCIFFTRSITQFYKQQQLRHYFNLHAPAPSAEVPRWVDKRIDATWQHRPGSTLAQIMACCLMSPSHYLNQRCLFVKGFVWHSA